MKLFLGFVGHFFPVYVKYIENKIFLVNEVFFESKLQNFEIILEQKMFLMNGAVA
jgi:hypothetical protein